jgi:hypothetical protein
MNCRCIHQKDVEERTQQVQLMGRIYEKYYEGIVYLGDSLDNKLPSADPPPVLHFDRDEPLPGDDRIRMPNRTHTDSQLCDAFSRSSGI